MEVGLSGAVGFHDLDTGNFASVLPTQEVAVISLR